MRFGAHEIMETHEILLEKINAITHFNLYAREAKHPQLRDMIGRHQQEEIGSYNEIVALTRGSNQFNPIPSNTPIDGVTNQTIQYGLRKPPQFAPQPNSTLSDRDIAIGMLCCHKNGARNCTWASLECADPNLRRTLFNCAATCNHQAYEVFLFLNQQGVYQVPTLQSETAENFLSSYQPAPDRLQAQYGMTNAPARGNMGTAMPAGAGYGQGGQAGTYAAGSTGSVLYGAGPAAPFGAPMGNPGMIAQGATRH